MKPGTLLLPSGKVLQGFLELLKPLVPASVYAIALALVRAAQVLSEELVKRKVSVARLRRLLFGACTETTSRLAARAGSGSGPRGSRTSPRGNPKGMGHGRNSLRNQFPGARRIPVPHPHLAAGSPCGADCSGKMYILKHPHSIPHVTGQPFLVMTIWDLQGLRCGACQRVERAPVPPEAAGLSKFDATAASILAVMHYANGMPFHRIDRHQKAHGVPIPETVQWGLVSKLSDDAQPAFEALLDVAARADLFHNDDTHKKILALLPARNPAPPESGAPPLRGKKPRTGLFTTAIVARSEDHTIPLFFTGRQHAGENLRDLLQRRPEGLPTPMQMCDGLSRNCPPGIATVLCNCLSHGRRKVADLVDVSPEPCLHVLEELKTIYIVDARARRNKLTREQRLALHQQESKPVMDRLHTWLAAQLAEKKVEPNSSLGGAFKYLLKRWVPLTMFLTTPGAPVDNNLAERVLKLAIRHRRNSLFYKTQRGADVGDCLMSLIYSCQFEGIEPFGYLTALQRHKTAVALDPASWLPWSYQASLAAIVNAARADAEPRAEVPAPEPGTAKGLASDPSLSEPIAHTDSTVPTGARSDATVSPAQTSPMPVPLPSAGTARPIADPASSEATVVESAHSQQVLPALETTAPSPPGQTPRRQAAIAHTRIPPGPYVPVSGSVSPQNPPANTG